MGIPGGRRAFVLVAVALLALGGLATGLAMSAARQVGYSRFLTGRSTEFGAAWASAVIAAVIFGVLGVCWWRLLTWEQRRDTGEGSVVAELHVARIRGLLTWIEVAFLLTSVASIAQLVGAVMASVGSVAIWAPDFNVGANMVAVLVIAVTGVVYGRRLRDRVR